MWVEKNIVFKFYGFLLPLNQNQLKYSHNKYHDKRVLREMTLKLAKIRKQQQQQQQQQKELEFAFYQKQVKAKLSAENGDILMTSAKNIRLYSKNIFASLKVFKLLSMCTKFQVNK